MQVLATGLVFETPKAKDFWVLIKNDDNFELVEVIKAELFGKERKLVKKIAEVEEKEEIFPYLTALVREKPWMLMVLNDDSWLTPTEKAYLRELLIESLKRRGVVEAKVEKAVSGIVEEELKELVRKEIERLGIKEIPSFDKSVVLKEKAIETAKKLLQEEPKLKEDLIHTYTHFVAKEIMEQKNLEKVNLDEVVNRNEGLFGKYVKIFQPYIRDRVKQLVQKSDLKEIIEDGYDKNLTEILGVDENKLVQMYAKKEPKRRGGLKM
jgi:hypothetical protein